MVYVRSGTPLVKDASSSGLQAVNGLGMLVAQGERAFEIWTGQKAPEGVMRQALDTL
jgi:shikimate dehydrogenase